MRTIKEEVMDYTLGFITYGDLVERIGATMEEDGIIVQRRIDEIKNSEAFFEIWNEFQGKLSKLYEENQDIDTIVSYHITKAYIQQTEPNKED